MTESDYLRQLSHAGILISQSKFDQAHDRLTNLMQSGHDDPEIIKMLAICKMSMGKTQDAKPLLESYMQKLPNDPYAFYLLSNIDISKRDWKMALENIDEAIRLDPTVTDFFSVKSNIFLQLKEYDQALRYADAGLELDAQNIDCLNARSGALMALGRKEDAYSTIQKSLAEDPGNPDTHANIGWGLLHQGKSVEALNHFKTALSEDPMHGYAKSGMLEAMKAKFPVYRYFLMLMLWLGKMKGKNQWTFLIVSYLAYRGLIYLAKNNEALRPLTVPLIALILLLFLSSWIFSPLMNLYMLSNPYGRYTITNDEKQSAKMTGFALLICVLALLSYFFIENNGLLTLSVSAFLMMIPLGSMNNAITEVNKVKLKNFTIFLTILVIINVLVCMFNDTAISSFSILPILSFLAYQWYANYILIKE